jgi:hypothetical protein
MAEYQGVISRRIGIIVALALLNDYEHGDVARGTGNIKGTGDTVGNYW